MSDFAPSNDPALRVAVIIGSARGGGAGLSIAEWFTRHVSHRPDIDLDVWAESLATIDRWQADKLLITHFGPASPVRPHLTEMRDHLDLVGQLAKQSLTVDGGDESKEGWFVDEVRRELRRSLSDADASAYEISGRFDLSWRGLARYWRKKEPVSR